MIEHLVADVLDAQVVDKHGKNAGRVDGIVLTWSPGTRPVVALIEIGPVTLLARFNRRLSAWYSRFDRTLGKGRGAPYRVPWDRITEQKRAFRLDVDTEATPINALEDYLRERVIEPVLGS
jgi:sporulation protein YlmC with PRC-barrel domain